MLRCTWEEKFCRKVQEITEMAEDFDIFLVWTVPWWHGIDGTCVFSPCVCICVTRAHKCEKRMQMQIQAQENEKLFIPCVDACVCICVRVVESVNPCICAARLASALAFASHVWNRLSPFHPRAIHVWMRQNTLLYVFETIDSTWRCTIASISSISRFASAHVRSACVNTSGVYVTWARVCFAFVNISQKFKKWNKEKRERSKSWDLVLLHEPYMYERNKILLCTFLVSCDSKQSIKIFLSFAHVVEVYSTNRASFATRARDKFNGTLSNEKNRNRHHWIKREIHAILSTM